MCPTPSLRDQIQVELCHGMKLQKPSYINTAKSYTVPVSMLEILNHEGLSGIPQLTLLSFVVVAERFKLKIEASPKKVKAWYEAWQAAQQTAQQSAQQTIPQSAPSTAPQTSSEGKQGRYSPADRATKMGSKSAAESKPTCHIRSRTVLFLWTWFALSAALALLLRRILLGERSVSCNC